MRKHFLILMLLTLLPLATWATKPTAKTAPTLKGAQEWTNQPLDLVATAVELPDGYDTSVGRVYYIALKSSQAEPIKSNPGWSTELPTKTDINEYRVYYYITNDGTASFNEDGDITLIGDTEISKATIKPANITSAVAAVAADSRKYNGGAEVALVTAPVFKGIINDDIITEYSTDGGSNWDTTIPTATVCGVNYTIKWRTKPTTHYASYTDGEDVTTSLNKADLTLGDVTYPTVISGLKYTGGEQQIFSQAGENTLGTVWFKVPKEVGEGWRYDVTDAAAKGNLTPGNHKIPFYVVAKDQVNYNDLGWGDSPAGDILVTIANGKAAIATEPTLVSDWTYDGLEKPLLDNAGSATNGTLVYYLGESETPLTKADVKALNAGTYTVSYSVTGNQYFDGIEKKQVGTVTIAQKPLTVSAQKVEVKWTGTAINYNEQQMVLAKNSEWAAADADPDARKAILAQMLTVTIPNNATDAGEYEFSVAEAYKQKTNYKPEILVPSNKLIINKIDGTAATVAGVTTTYNTEDQVLATANNTALDGGKMQYQLMQGSTELVAWTNDLTAIKAAAAGDYKVNYKFVGDNNHNDGAVAFVESKINAATDNVKTAFVKADDKTYDGVALNLVAAGEAFEGTVSYKVNDGEWSTTAPTATTIGVYTVSYKTTGAENYVDIPETVLGKVTIAQNENNVKTAFAKAADKTYDGEALTLVTAGEANEGTVSYKVNEGEWSTTVPSATEAGEYTVSYKTTDAVNYVNIPETVLGKVTIAQNENNVKTAFAKAADKTYDGEALTLVTAGEANEGTVSYKVNEGEWSTTVPSATEAGEYTVSYKTTGAENYVNIPETVLGKVTIAQNENNVKTAFAKAADKTYDGEALTLVTAGEANEGTVSYKVNEGEWSTTVPSATEAGEYTVSYKTTGAENYVNIPETVLGKVTIAQQALEPVAPTAKKNLVFTGSAQALITEAENANVNVAYTINGEAVEAVEATAADTYTVGFAFTPVNANYVVAEGFASGSFDVTIAQKPVTPVAPAAIALTYNGLAQELVTAGSAEGATIQYALGEGEFGDAIPTAKDAGTYTVKYKFTVDDDYSFTPTEGEVNVKINKAHLAYSLGNQTATYTGEAIAPVLGQAYDLADGDLMVGDDEAFTLSFPATEAKNFTDVNTYNFSKLNVTWNEGFKENYTIQFYNNGSLTIEKAPIVAADYTAPAEVDGTITFDGDAHALFTAGSWKDKSFGTFWYSEDEENWSTEIADKTDAGKYNLYWKIVADDNHIDLNSADHLTKTIVAKEWNATVPAFFDGDLTKVYAKGHDYLSDFEGALGLFDGKNALTENDYDLVITNSQIDPETEQPVVATEAIDVDVYTFTYTGKNNYAGNETAWTLTINKAELVDNFALSATEAEYSSEDQLPTLKAAAGLEKDVDFTVVAPAKAINVGEYNFVITPGKNYYLTGEAENYTKTFEITKATVLISAGNCEKVYNGEAGLAGATKPELLFAGIKKNDKAEEVITKKDPEAYGVTVAEASKNFGTYALNIDLDAFEVANNNYKLAANDVQGSLTISKKDLAIAFNDHDAEGNYLIQKNYGEADNFAEVADLVTLEGAVAADAADIYDGITVTRSNATENSVGKYEDVLEIATKGGVFANYNVDATAKGDFEIVAGTLTIALKTALTQEYNGVAPANTLEITAADLAVTGMDEGDKIEDIFTTLPTVTVQNGAKDAATYVVKLSGGVAPNYNLEEATYLDGQYIITPKELTATIGTQIVSVEATKLPNENGFSIEGAVDGDDLKAALSINAPVEAAGTFDDGILLTINNANYTLKNNTGKLIVVDAAEDGLVFDTNTVDIVETLQASNGATCDITIKGRSTNNNGIEAKKWIGMVLPFDVTVEELVEVFGYSIINTYDAENSSAAHMKFQVEQDGIPANTPFIIKPKKNISAAEGFTFEGVTIKAPATASVSVEVGGNSFVGQYEAYTIEKKETPNSTYLRDGGWKRAKNSDRVIVPFDCYITWPEGNSAPSISIEDEGGVTKIATITTDGRIIEAEGWYTVNGMKLDAAPTEKGVYIKDGQKVVIK